MTALHASGRGAHREVVLHVCRVGCVPSFSFCTLVLGTNVHGKGTKKIFYTEKKSFNLFDLYHPSQLTRVDLLMNPFYSGVCLDIKMWL